MLPRRCRISAAQLAIHIAENVHEMLVAPDRRRWLRTPATPPGHRRLQQVITARPIRSSNRLKNLIVVIHAILSQSLEPKWLRLEPKWLRIDDDDDDGDDDNDDDDDVGYEEAFSGGGYQGG